MAPVLDAKARRRRELASLPFEKKLEIVLELQRNVAEIRRSTGRPGPQPWETPSAASRRGTLLHEELARFVRILAPRPGIEKVILFGSLARDEASESSDIDLLIVERTALSFWRRLREVRRILQPCVATDLLVYTPEEFDVLCRERPFVRDEILAKGRILYERHA